MPSYRIFRMKDNPRQNFRWAPHTSGVTQVKLKDYEQGESVEAANHYEAWEQLRETEQALRVGDILETELGEIRICKYVGFEEAKWILPENRPAGEAAPVAEGAPTAPATPAKL